MNSEGWLDMGRYPNLEPDQAVDPHQLLGLRDALHAAPAQPLTDERWSSLLDTSAPVSEPEQQPAPADPAPAHADPAAAADPSHEPSPWHGYEHGSDLHDFNTHNGYDGHDLHFHD